MANQIVFVMQIPLPRDGRVLDFSRWQQNMIGILQVDIPYDEKVYTPPHSKITLDMRLAYRNKEDPADKWTHLAHSLEERDLNCHMNNDTDKYMYDCDMIPVFELGSLHHDFYLVNIRVPVDSEHQLNTNIGFITDMQLSFIYQNGGFTKVWMGLKTVFFPCIVAIMFWFWNRVHMLERKPVLLEYMLIYLGAALTFLNRELEIDFFLCFFNKFHFHILTCNLSTLLSMSSATRAPYTFYRNEIHDAAE